MVRCYIFSVLLAVSLAVGEAGRFVDAIARVQPAVVRITTDKLRARRPAGQFPLVQVRSAGTGFVFDTSGHILTCNHVISGYEEILVELHDGTEYKGEDVRVVGRDPVTDLAVLQVRARGLPAPAELGNSDLLDIGQWVIALGSPFGLQGSAAAGVVSGLSRWGLAKRSGPDFQDFIQTDALMNPGNSGGPLIDTQGRVVGVNSFVRTSSEGEHTGIGFAIPVNLASEVARDLISHGEVVRGYLGINTQPVTDEIRLALGLQEQSGVLVASVALGRPGARAGIKPGDVVLMLDQEPVPDVRWFQNRVASGSPGDSVGLVLFRQGQTMEFGAQLEAWPVAGTEPRKAPPVRYWLGLLARELDDADKLRTGTEHGVAVQAVEPASPADESNIRAGDVIVEINFAVVEDKKTFAVIAEKMAGYDRPALIRLLRGRTAFYTAVGP